MQLPFLILSQSDYLIQIVDLNSHSEWQIVQIQISWLLQKPTDLDLHCLQRQGISGFSRTRVNLNLPYLHIIHKWCSVVNTYHITFCTSLCILLFVTRNTDHLFISRNKTLISDWFRTLQTAETLLMPLSTFVLKFLHTWHKIKTILYFPSIHWYLFTRGFITREILT